MAKPKRTLRGSTVTIRSSTKRRPCRPMASRTDNGTELSPADVLDVATPPEDLITPLVKRRRLCGTSPSPVNISPMDITIVNDSAVAGSRRSLPPVWEPRIDWTKQLKDFGGKEEEDVDAWIMKFDLVTTYISAPAQRLDLLRLHLTGRAQESYMSMPEEEKTDIERIKARLRRVFSKIGNSAYWDEKLSSIRIQRDESLESFAQRIASLVYRRYGEENNPMAIVSFVNGLASGIAVEVRGRRPKTLGEAIEIANLEIYLQRERERERASKSHRRPTSEGTAHLNGILGVPTATPSSSATRACFLCKSTDHLKRECPTRQKRCYLCGSEQHLRQTCPMRTQAVPQPSSITHSKN